MSFEDSFLGKIDRKRANDQRTNREAIRDRIELPPVVLEAHKRAEREIFSNRDYRVQAPEFESVYGMREIMMDMQRVFRLKKQFESEATPFQQQSQIMSEVFEGILLMHSELSNWLGEAQTLKTSIYDDYINGTDMYAEWHSPQEGSRVLALAVDVTFSKTSINKKLRKIRGEMDSGEMGKIRYFKDSRGDFMGTRSNVPRVVIGAYPGSIEELSKLWMANDNKALAQHPIQRVLVEEMYGQLKGMHTYAEKRGMHTPAQAYQQALAIVEKLHKEKAGIDLGKYSDDKVMHEISAQTREVFGSK